LLRQDAFTQGPKLFAKNCASCHRFDGHDGLGLVTTNPPAASDLKGFASRDWLAGLLDPGRISSAHYFGATQLADGKMSKFVKKDVARFSSAQKEQLRKVIMAVSAEAQLKSQSKADTQDAGAVEEGRKLVASDDMRCTECHQFHKAGEDPTGPD